MMPDIFAPIGKMHIRKVEAPSQWWYALYPGRYSPRPLMIANTVREIQEHCQAILRRQLAEMKARAKVHEL